ncbi:MAG: TetR/AcrR family transcriptional regulator [Bacteroidales bacterium]
MEEKKDFILSQSLSIFQEYGIKSISMDDLSSSMRISKKTLYKYFKNKEDLIHQLFFNYITEKFASFQTQINSEPINAIDYLIKVHSFLFSQKHIFTTAINYDLQTTYPHLYTKLHQQIQKHSHILLQKNITLGQQQHLYKKNIDTSIIIYIFTHLSLLIENNSDNEISSHDLFNEILRMFIYSVANEAGIVYYKNISSHTS